jgi:hypothetical protein
VVAPLALLLGAQRPARRDAVVAVVLALAVVWVSVGPARGFDQLVRAWMVLLTASLAIVVASGRATGFMSTALAAVSGAFGAAFVLALITRLSWGKVVWMAEREYGAVASSLIQTVAALLPAGATPAAGGSDLATTIQTSLLFIARAVSTVFPGLVLLQSFAALALAWALYHRLARHPQGEALAPLASFRFNDHLIWGVAGSLLVLVVPRLGWINALGGNLLVFFSGLYVVRGVAVLSAAAAAGVIGGPIAILAATFLTLFLTPVAALGALALGLTDTLMDWRQRLARAVPKP